MSYKHIFITGAGRSGTGYLQRILNMSPSVHITTEIHYFSSLYHNGLLKNLKKIKKNYNEFSINEVFYCLTQMRHFGVYWNIFFS